MAYRSPYMPMTEEERMRQAIMATRNPFGPKTTMESQVRDATARLDPKNMPAIRATPLSEQLMVPPEADFSSEEAAIANQQAYANTLRGREMPQGRTVGPSNIYVNNPWDAVGAGAERALGGYFSGQAAKQSAALGEKKRESALKRARRQAEVDAMSVEERRRQAERADTRAALEYDADARRAAAEGREYVEFTDGESTVRGYVEEGRAFDERGQPLPAGFREIYRSPRASGSRLQPLTEKDAFGNEVVVTFDKTAAPGDEYGSPKFIDGTPWSEEEAKRRGSQRAGQEGDVTREKERAKTNVDEAVTASEKIASLGGVANQLEVALAAIEEGAESGPIAGRLPTMRGPSVKLENARDRLALFDLGNYTFGQLSNAEGQWLKDTSIPMTLDESELKPFLQKRLEATRRAIKAERYAEEMRLAGYEPDRDVLDKIKYGGGFTWSD